MIDQRTYRTRNLNLASYLAAAGLQLVGTSKIKGSLFFEFLPENRAKILVENYFADKAIVNPRELFARLNSLRDLIFQEVKA